MAGKLGSGNSKDTAITKKTTGTRLGPKVEQGPKKSSGPSVASKVVSSVKKAVVSDGEYAKWLKNKLATEAQDKLKADIEKNRKIKAQEAAKTNKSKTTSTPKTTTKAPAKKTPMPKSPAMPTRRPAVGSDKAAQKKYGSSSWNNGYTN